MAFSFLSYFFFIRPQIQTHAESDLCYCTCWWGDKDGLKACMVRIRVKWDKIRFSKNRGKIPERK